MNNAQHKTIIMKKMIRYIEERCVSRKRSATHHPRGGLPSITLAVALGASLPLGSRAAEILVPSDAIATIQQAVDAAAPGDTIKVLPGTYDESVFVGTAGVKLEAETEAGPVAVTGFLVLADDVGIKGFAVGSDGITMIDSTGGRVSNNSVSTGGIGIFVLDSPGSQIDNNALEADSGVWVSSCAGARVNQNKADAAYIGIYVEDSFGARIDHNRVAGRDSAGISIWSSSGGRVEYNHAEGPHGIEVAGESCGNAFEHNEGVGSLFGLYSEDSPDAPCNSYSKNAAGHTFPSLS